MELYHATSREDCVPRRLLQRTLLGVLIWMLLASAGAHANPTGDGGRPVERISGLTATPDPKDFIAGMAVTMPTPIVPLSRHDAVTQELLRKSRTLTAPDAARTAQVMCREADTLGYDPLLFVALIRIESNFNHLAISPVGAEGLMQLMPPTAKWMADRLHLEWPDNHSFDPVLNVTLGIRYLALLDRQFKGRMDLALTAYNRGPRATNYLLRHNNDRLPKDIRDFYATKVLDKYATLRATYGHLPPS